MGQGCSRLRTAEATLRDVQPAALWRRYLRFRKNPVYDGVITGCCFMPLILLWHPFGNALDVLLAFALPVTLGLLGRRERRAERE